MIHETLRKRFGFDSFRPGQESVIRDVVARKSQIAILPTGSGKSLCFQLPAYLIEGTVLIVSPLVALMEDQVTRLKEQGEKRVAALNSFHSYQERAYILNYLEHYKFIFVSPEMLTVPKVARRIQRLPIAFIVVDEAHCISQWGFDFRPDYLRISEFLKTLEDLPVLALTATANQKVLADIKKYLNLDDPSLHIYSLDRPNLSYVIHKMESEEEKTAWLFDRLQESTGPGIIYVASRKRADELAAQLRTKEISATSYHAGMEQEDRAFVQAQFLQGDVEWICATNAFGMGIHKDDVRQVIHEHIPSTIANYVQEVGRAGRDGELSIASLIYTEDDIRKTRFIMHEGYPTETEIRYVHQLQGEGKSLEEAAQLAGLSETGMRMLDYYFEKISVHETIAQINKLSKGKEYELRQMIELLENENCIRASILYFFGENLQEKPEICCGNCQFIHAEILDSIKYERSERKWCDWSERLTRLLG